MKIGRGWQRTSEAELERSEPAVERGIVLSVHGLSILDAHGLRHRWVVRRYMGAYQREWGARAIRREAAVLSALERSGLPAPRLVDADPDGMRAGVPAIVMSRVPGRIHLTPERP